MNEEKTTPVPDCITHPKTETISRQFQFKFKLPTCPFFMKQIESQSTGLEKRSQIRPSTQMIHSEWQRCYLCFKPIILSIDVREKANSL